MTPGTSPESEPEEDPEDVIGVEYGDDSTAMITDVLDDDCAVGVADINLWRN